MICDPPEAGESCWCAGYPNIILVGAINDCLCETCLRSAILKKLQKPKKIQGITEEIVCKHMTTNAFTKLFTKSVDNSVDNTL